MKIGAITLIEADRLALAGQFVRHYTRWCQPEDIHFLVLTDGVTYGGISQMLDFIKLCGCNSVVDGKPFETDASHYRVRDLTREIFNDDGWHFNVDSDEFFDRDVDVHELVRLCEKVGHLFVRAEMVDMVSQDGLLPEIPWDSNAAYMNKAQPDIYDTFPVEFDVTGKIVQGYKVKDCLLKNPHWGWHNAWGVDLSRCPSKIYDLHHFKWDATAIGRMRHRLENKDRFPYWQNFKNFVDYYDEHGRILIGS